jgi:hypothetical protein
MLLNCVAKICFNLSKDECFDDVSQCEDRRREKKDMAQAVVPTAYLF